MIKSRMEKSQNRYFIVESGSKQFKVSPNNHLKIDYISGLEEGATIKIKRILDSNVGIVNDEITCKVLNPMGKEDKIIIYKKKRRARYEKKIGFRARYTLISIPE